MLTSIYNISLFFLNILCWKWQTLSKRETTVKEIFKKTFWSILKSFI